MRPFPYQDLIGKPYQLGARGPDAFDCYGLVQECLRRQGLEPPEYISEEDALARGKTIAAARPSWKLLDRPEVGAVVGFRMLGDLVTHVGVVVAPDRFLHIMALRNVTVERLSHPLWAKRAEIYATWPC